MTVAVNMPQMAANGLSENWLFKFSGDLHWQALCRSLHTTSAALCSDSGDRLYPSFVAIAARYSAPLSAVQENDVLEEAIECRRYGSSFFHGVSSLGRGDLVLSLEMLTAFVSRATPHGNDLRKSTPAARFTFDGPIVTDPPELLARSARMRKGAAPTLCMGGFEVSLAAPSLGLEEPYEPNPYVDYNGANLLYYAAYPTVCDGLERRIIQSHRLVTGLDRDWALAASTVSRDVFYYRNLDLGDRLVLRLDQLHQTADRVLTCSALLRASDRAVIAELFTVKALLR